MQAAACSIESSTGQLQSRHQRIALVTMTEGHDLTNQTGGILPSTCSSLHRVSIYDGMPQRVGVFDSTRIAS